jgi:hypothetical protein
MPPSNQPTIDRPTIDRPALAWLPALFAAVMLASGSAWALPVRAALCSGGSAELPGRHPAKGCDQACHSGCQRRKGRAQGLPD